MLPSRKNAGSKWDWKALASQREWEVPGRTAPCGNRAEIEITWFASGGASGGMTACGSLGGG